ncbi:MAG: hypothetical protein WCP09_00485 [Candidatus Taylorbacteria bacterium]
MPHTKTSGSSKKTKPIAKDPNEEGDEVVAPVQKISKVVEVDIQDDVIGTVEEKPEVDPLLSEDESEDSSSEESGLDDEEINPFGDKWEI